MRILLIGNPNIVHVRRYAQDLTQRGHEIHLVGEHPLAKRIPEGCHFYDLTQQLNIRKLRYLFWPSAIKKLVKQIQPDIIHAIGVASAGWLGAFSGFHPWIITAIGSDLMLLDQKDPVHQYLTRLALHRADRVICVSRPLYDRALELGAGENKTQIIYIGIDTTIFRPRDKVSARNKLGLPDNPLVLSIRAMSPVYRLLDLARAIPVVLRSVPQARFVIFVYNVDQPTYDTFKKTIDQLGAGNAVNYVNEIHDEEEISLYYQSARLAVSIPESDGTPSSVLEAMACGLPVIATDLPSLREWIIPDHSGILIKVGDVEALANATVELLNNPARAEKMGTNASRDKLERASRSKCLDQLEDVYRSLVS